MSLREGYTHYALRLLRRMQLHAFDADRYERMRYRRCGASGLLLPAISLGAWETFGGYRGEEVARAT